MPQKRNPCKNHPAKLTVRKCYYCKDSICSACQLHLDHHLFCGNFCYSRWKWKEIYKNINLSKELVGIFVLLVISNLIIIFYFNIKFETLKEELKVVENLPEKNTQVKNHQFKIDSVRYPLENMMQLKLNLTNGAVVALNRDGAFVESEIQDSEAVYFSDQILHQGPNNFSIYMLDNGGKSYLVDSFSVDFNSSRIDYMRRYINEIKDDSNGIALTFDGGSQNHGTSKILDILREKQIQCTIFLTGSYLENNPDLTKLMTQDGHEIGNHSFSHPHLTTLEIDGSTQSPDNVNRQFLHNELNSTDSLFYSITKKHLAPFWRAPFGEINQDILLWAAEAGYKHVGWSRYI